MGLFRKKPPKGPYEEFQAHVAALAASMPSDREKVARGPGPAFPPPGHPDPAVAEKIRRLFLTEGAATSTLYGVGELTSLARMVMGSGDGELMAAPSDGLPNEAAGGGVEWAVEGPHFLRLTKLFPREDQPPETRGAFFSGPHGCAFVHTRFPDPDGGIDLSPAGLYVGLDWEWHLHVSWEHYLNAEPQPDPAALLAEAQIVALSRLLQKKSPQPGASATEPPSAAPAPALSLPPSDPDPVVAAALRQLFTPQHATACIVYGTGAVQDLAGQVSERSPGIKGLAEADRVLRVTYPTLDAAAAFFSGPDGAAFILTCSSNPGAETDWDMLESLMAPLAGLGGSWHDEMMFAGQASGNAADVLSGATVVPFASLPQFRGVER